MRIKQIAVVALAIGTLSACGSAATPSPTAASAPPPVPVARPDSPVARFLDGVWKNQTPSQTAQDCASWKATPEFLESMAVPSMDAAAAARGLPRVTAADVHLWFAANCK